MVSFTPFPKIETRNLFLRKMEHGDAEDLYEMRRDPLMNEHTDTKPDETINETRNYIDKMLKGVDNNEWILWSIEYKQTKKVIGTICIWNIRSGLESGELGYGIIPAYQGKGLMKEALSAVMEYGFEGMGLKALEAYTEVNNLKSVKLLESCGFVEVDRVDDEGYFNDRVYHMIVYKLEKSRNNY